MNLKVLFLILLYYSALSAFILFPGSPLGAYNVNVDLNQTELSEDEKDTGGLFSSGVDFGRFFSLVTIGVGVPGDVPTWFKFMFAIWQSLWLLFSIGFVISSIWDG